ncbi:hypothetical protein HBB16_00245 [Pseudonocardia sp. MCCB 268]|nr:hypothetical protein [Pseudonocardia cytotoxica]
MRLRFRLSQGDSPRTWQPPENVPAALSTLIGAGVISQRDGHFYIRDRTALERAAQTTDAGL